MSIRSFGRTSTGIDVRVGSFLTALFGRLFRRSHRSQDCRPPAVGPILGALTETGVRVFCQWRPAAGLGYAQLTLWPLDDTGRPEAGTTKVIRLNPNFAHSGVFVVEGLAAGRPHAYRVGVFTAAAYDEACAWARAHPLRWSHDAPVFRTRESVPDRHRIALGSCRYALRLGAGDSDSFLFDDRSDKAYGSILRVHQARPLDNLVFVGDQIYADDLNDFRNDVSFQQYAGRYESLFGTRWFRMLSSVVPTVNLLDDHEIEDNYPAKADRTKLLTKVPAALHAFDVFQMSYSPLYEASDGRIVGRPNRYWYAFRDGIVEYFVTDTRTERVLRTDGRESRLFSAAQLSALVKWMTDDSDCAYKVVLAAVPLVPLSKGTLHGFGGLAGDAPDKWDVSPKQRDSFLSATERVRQRLVVLSGDIHVSTVGTVMGDASMFHNIVSSPVYWPYPHGSAVDFHMDGELTRGFRYECSPVIATDNFAEIEFRPDRLEVRFWPRKVKVGTTPLFHYTHDYEDETLVSASN